MLTSVVMKEVSITGCTDAKRTKGEGSGYQKASATVRSNQSHEDSQSNHLREEQATNGSTQNMSKNGGHVLTRGLTARDIQVFG